MNFILTANNFNGLITALRRLDPTKQWIVKAVERKSQRTLQQNKWVRKFALEWGKHVGYEADEAYDILMYKCNPIFIIDPITKEEIRLAGHFSKLDTKDGAECQERIIRFGEEQGFIFD